MSVSIIAPYRSGEVEIIKECDLSALDRVERGGYVPNEVRIQKFIDSGMVLFGANGQGAGEYEILGSESDFEADSEEYRDELEAEAENYKEAPLMQYMDKITAEEVLDNAEKALRASEEAKKDTKHDRATEQANETASRAVKEVLESEKKEEESKTTIA